MNSIRHCLWLAFLLYSSAVECAVTMEQMEKASDIVRGICLSRVKTAADMANGLRVGNFPNDKSLKCYTQCVLEMNGMMKKNKLNYEASLKQMDKLLPDDILDDNKNALTMCKDIANGIKDVCEAGYAITQCLYKNNKRFTFA